VSVGVAFRYRASDASGTFVDGVVRAATRDAALRELRQRQLWPVQVEAMASPGATGAPALRTPFGGTARRRAVADWVRTLATLLAAGAPMDRALRVARAQVTHAEFGAVADAVLREVRGGASLAGALRVHPAWFGALHVGVAEAGEAAGALDRSLETLAGFLDEEVALRAQLASALLYPALMGVVASAGILVLLFVVVPRFATLLAELGGTLPFATRVLVAAGDAVRGWWWLMLVAVVGAGAAGRAWLATPEARARWATWRLRLPIVGGLERTLATARFTRALGMLLDAGVPVLGALRLARGSVGNVALADGLRGASERVARGERLGAAHEGLLTPLAVQLLAVGEEGAQVGALALRAAERHDEEARRGLRTLAALLEPALIVVFGALVGFVALAMLQAIYAVNAGIK
jgi:type II secretory pathway component PulF